MVKAKEEKFLFPNDFNFSRFFNATTSIAHIVPRRTVCHEHRGIHSPPFDHYNVRIVRERVGKTFFCLHRHWAWTRSQGGTNVKKSPYFAFATNLLFLSPLRQYIACGARKRKPKKIQKGKKHFCSRWPSLIYNLNIYHGLYFGITPRCTYLLPDV